MSKYSRTSYIQRQQRARRIRIALAAAAAVIVIALVLGIRLASVVMPYRDTFLPTVTVSGHSLTGYTYEQAIEELNSLYDQSLTQSVRITYGDEEWTFSPRDVDAHVDVEEQVAAAWRFGKEGSVFERRQEILALRESPVDLPVTLTYDEEALAAYVQSVKAQIDRAPTDATITLDGSEKPIITESDTGLLLDGNVLRAQLENMIMSGEAQDIELEPQVLAPAVATTQVSSEFVLLAEFSTSLEGSSSDRNSNVALALSNFNGLVVQPGQTVSFNTFVGERSTQKGYKEANEYDGTVVVKGIGGGACQASTTLYGAILRVPLQIEDRTSHRMCVSYVPPSQDAAVSFPDKDLVFTNTIGEPLYFFAGVDYKKKVAYVKIYGAALNLSYYVRIRSEVLERDIKSAHRTYIDDTAGTRVWYTDETVLYKVGQTGMRSRAYREYVDITTGEVINQQLLGEDYYYPASDTYLRGVHQR